MQLAWNNFQLRESVKAVPATARVAHYSKSLLGDETFDSLNYTGVPFPSRPGALDTQHGSAKITMLHELMRRNRCAARHLAAVPQDASMEYR